MNEAVNEVVKGVKFSNNDKEDLFNYWNYHCVYSSDGTVDREMEPDCCFRYITKYNPQEHMNNKYQIVVYKGENLIDNKSLNNACFGDKDFILRHLYMLNKYVPIEYSVEDYTYKTYDCYKINLHIDAPYIEHKFILTMIRPLYEFPFNMAYIDVKRLREDPEFSKYTSINLYAMTSMFMRLTGTDVIDDQSLVAFLTWPLPKFAKFMTRDEVVKRLQEIAEEDVPDDEIYEQSIHSLFEYVPISDELTKEIRKYYKGNDDDEEDDDDIDDDVDCPTIENLTYWRDKTEFEVRKNFYRQIIQFTKRNA